ncbi:amidohydrolase [Dysgonomonas sp. 216]|uniref:amidohydrolase n=1 Tax=Dysgonomonas sp. 216 TaxID=2302934 RepID=UPI0013D3234D|nr:amidohydrolase [Dysgonomonas sp. 216]NDW18217.1 amidohydrolase [Dysgonomonas sp. 216]
MNLRVAIVQFDIVWEDKKANLDKVETFISNIAGQADLVVLPEMFTTGFSMNSAKLSEENSGNTMQHVSDWAKRFDVAICGSFIATENGNFYNRGFFITANTQRFYNKRHLFRMGDEPKYFSNGKKRLIVEHKGFKICLLVCYDLRFPVWARNVNNEYDLLIYVANWPASRAAVWSSLLVARAIENMAYVCGVNRVGKDGLNLVYDGRSAVIDAKGKPITNVSNGIEAVEIVEISKEKLDDFRAKFPVWKDADSFDIKY